MTLANPKVLKLCIPFIWFPFSSVLLKSPCLTSSNNGCVTLPKADQEALGKAAVVFPWFLWPPTQISDVRTHTGCFTPIHFTRRNSEQSQPLMFSCHIWGRNPEEAWALLEWALSFFLFFFFPCEKNSNQNSECKEICVWSIKRYDMPRCQGWTIRETVAIKSGHL